jgi:hypothetical protein
MVLVSVKCPPMKQTRVLGANLKAIVSEQAAASSPVIACEQHMGSGGSLLEMVRRNFTVPISIVPTQKTVIEWKERNDPLNS